MAKHQAPKRVVRTFFFFFFWFLCTQINCTCFCCCRGRASYTLWTKSRWMLLYFTFICLSKQNYDGNSQRQKWWQPQQQPQQQQQQLLNLRKSLVCQWVNASFFCCCFPHLFTICLHILFSIDICQMVTFIRLRLLFGVFLFIFFSILFSSPSNFVFQTSVSLSLYLSTSRSFTQKVFF